ncbi:unnamed protein product [Cylicocyclus nassatus]|uniref:KAP NTPase domain-containing protein n=1 Tax=Cylicocyclus nassatus TaxID=53992 RepID=A0AA36GDP5_CYLNA|nr:unnamed protein product [Cylicocyclus nassatus]
MDTILGYDVYSNVLADIVCEPSLSLPLIVGSYAKWGSEKSILLAKFKDSMNSFSRNWLEGAHLRCLIFFYLTLFCVIFTMTISSHVLQQPPGLIVVWVLVAAFSSCSYPLISIILLRYGCTNVSRKRVSEAAQAVLQLRFEELMQKLQSEVDILADMIGSLDAFSRSQTRLVVVVDGLDNCGQERMV